MPKLTWDGSGDRLFETGISRGVLYLADNTGAYPLGVPWNGLTTVTESPSGAESNKQYADNIQYLNLISAELFGGTIEAFTSPVEFDQCDGSVQASVGVSVAQQARKAFGLAYRSELGNDLDGVDHGYKLHLVYGAQASPSEKAFTTINESPEAMTLSWEFSTTPVAVSGLKPTSILTINSTLVDPAALLALEAILYGDEIEDARLPLPDEVIALFETP